MKGTILLVLAIIFAFVVSLNLSEGQKLIKLSNGIVINPKRVQSLNTLTSNSFFSTLKKKVSLKNQEDKILIYVQLKEKLSSKGIKIVEDYFNTKVEYSYPDSQTLVLYSSLSKAQFLNGKITSVVNWVGLVEPEHKMMTKHEELHNIENVIEDQIFEKKLQQSKLRKHNIYNINELINPSSSFRSPFPELKRKNFIVPINFVLQTVKKVSNLEEMIRIWTEDFNKNSKQNEVFVRILKSSINSNKLILSIFIKNLKQNKINDAYNKIIQFFALKPEITWIERKMNMELKNHESQAIISTGNRDLIQGQSDSRYNFLFSQGIDGKDQIIGAGDTGIDWDNCFFYDPEVPMKFNELNPKHRKIVGYYTVTVKDPRTGEEITTDTHDYVDGHGTHVSGSIAGNMYHQDPSMNKYHGMAPKAKLFFVDIQNTERGGLTIPEDLNKDYFPIFYKGGAKLMSNSWGCSFGLFQCKFDCNCVWAQTTQYGRKGEKVDDSFCQYNFGRRCCQICNRYDSQSGDVDEFLYNHQDALILFAAGNSGRQAFTGTLNSPATAKNCLTVGASETNQKSWMDLIKYIDIQENLDYIGLPSEEACCNFVYPDPKVQKQVRQFCCKAEIKKDYEQKKWHNMQNMADFSSRGPAIDTPTRGLNSQQQRIGLDVVVPGNRIVSTHSDGRTDTFNCENIEPKKANKAALLVMQGTSMATPLTAGTAGLVRQYWQKFISKYSYNSRTLLVQGPLVKATLVHAASVMEGLAQLSGHDKVQQLKDLKYPNEFNGFGLIDLSTTLAFQNLMDQGNQPKFQLFASQNFLGDSGMSIGYNFVVEKDYSQNSTRYFRATLAYFDKPSHPSSGLKLIHDLDLVVIVTKTSGAQKTYYGNDIQGGDKLNNVERIMIKSDELSVGDKIQVLVKADSLTENQKYALVMTGNKISRQ